MNSLRFELGVRDITGLAANFRAREAGVVACVKAAVETWGEATKQLTYELCPVDTGFMRDHIRLEFSPEGFAFDCGWWVDDFVEEGLAFYPFFVEYGTVKMAAQPSLGPAYEITSVELTREISECLRQEFSARGSGGLSIRGAGRVRLLS